MIKARKSQDHHQEGTESSFSVTAATDDPGGEKVHQYLDAKIDGDQKADLVQGNAKVPVESQKQKGRKIVYDSLAYIAHIAAIYRMFGSECHKRYLLLVEYYIFRSVFGGMAIFWLTDIQVLSWVHPGKDIPGIFLLRRKRTAGNHGPGSVFFSGWFPLALVGKNLCSNGKVHNPGPR